MNRSAKRGSARTVGCVLSGFSPVGLGGVLSSWFELTHVVRVRDLRDPAAYVPPFPCGQRWEK